MHYTPVFTAMALLIYPVDSFLLQPSFYVVDNLNNHVKQRFRHHQMRRRFLHLGSSLFAYKDSGLLNTTKDELETCHIFDELSDEDKALSSSDEECAVDGPQCLLVMESDEDERRKSSNKVSAGAPLDNKMMKSISFLPYDEDASEMELIMDKVLRFVPFSLPVIAYSLYDPTAVAFASVINFLSSKNWIAVDGGTYQAMIIAPVINGVVVAAISLLFAIEIGLTITKLWQRKNDIQLCITIEATKLMVLKNLLSDFPLTNKTQEKCKSYLLQYTSRLISECHETVNIALTDISQTDSELDGCLQELNKAAAASESSGYCTMLIDQAMAAVESLSQNRSKRISALQSTFPILHYVLLATLASSICFAFLVETDQDILVFLNAIQLRLLWTMLVATFSALGLVCYDLEHPFRGFYQISDSVKELYAVRLEYTSESTAMGKKAQ